MVFKDCQIQFSPDERGCSIAWRRPGGRAFGWNARRKWCALGQRSSCCCCWRSEYGSRGWCVDIVIKRARGTDYTVMGRHISMAKVASVCNRLAKQHQPSQQRDRTGDFVTAVLPCSHCLQNALAPRPADVSKPVSPTPSCYPRKLAHARPTTLNCLHYQTVHRIFGCGELFRSDVRQRAAQVTWTSVLNRLNWQTSRMVRQIIALTRKLFCDRAAAGQWR